MSDSSEVGLQTNAITELPVRRNMLPQLKYHFKPILIIMVFPFMHQIPKLDPIFMTM